MNPASILARYIARQFVAWFLALIAIVSSIVVLLEGVELLRRAAGRPGVTMALVFKMAILKSADTAQQVFPFVVLFSAMYTFWRLTRSQELVVVRAAGVSAWQFLAPAIASAFLIGVIKVTALNPVAAVMTARYQQLEDRYLKGQESVLTVSGSGVWLRQPDGKGFAIIHAASVKPGTMDLRQVMVLRLDADNRFRSRIDAADAALGDGFWDLHKAWINRPNHEQSFVASDRLPTDLTARRIAESFAAPDTLSFWQLPGFIHTLDATGLSSVRHRVQYQSLLAQPFLLCAMVLFAAAFSLRQTRRGGTLPMISSGIATGLVLFVLTSVAAALGTSETIPVALAAWTAPVVGLILGTYMILHLEDG